MAFVVNVPNAPGVPSVSFAAGPISATVSLLTSDAIGNLAGLFGLNQQWGIFQNGAAVITADNVAAVDYKQEWSISDYPVERGAFETYNKVSTPFDVRVRFTAGGSLGPRSELLSSIAAIAGNTQLYDVVTPEAVYTSVNIMHYDYRRTAQSGVGLLQVDVWCLQINENVTVSSGTASPSGADQVNGGPVQTSAPSATQISTAGSALVSDPTAESAAGGIP